VIWHFWKATAAKRMDIDLYCRWQLNEWR